MELVEVKALVDAQIAGNMTITNGHRIELGQAMIPPRRVSLVWRNVANGVVTEELLEAWLVGQEDDADGYKLVLREDGKQFGLASVGHLTDKHLSLVGWYGSLSSAFLGM